MRYLNWDVLLFPEDSKIPIQEFDIKCYALPVSPGEYSKLVEQTLQLTFSSDISQPNRLLTLADTSYQVSVSQVPTLTGFISSLDSGRTFRVSIHSWERPQPSELLQRFKSGPGRVVFEARLYIDGKLKVQRYLGEHSSWPEVIDCMARRSHDPFPMPLRFPPFHAEVLQQSHWGAGDDVGRIKIVIAEGLAHGDSYIEGRGYDRLRDVVAFSFQHAPKNILEYSGIAWPNARMFQKTVIPTPQRPDFDSHAHSPQRSVDLTMDMFRKQIMHKKPATPMSLQSSKWAGKASIIADDPFVGPAQTLRNARKTSGDVSMSDYVTSTKPSKNNSEMTGVAVQQADFPQQVNRAAVEEILGALSPAKRQALLDALTPSKQASTTSTGTSRTLANSSEASVNGIQPALRPTALMNTRRSSTDSRRSMSGQSATMSWEGTPTLGDLWSGNDYPGLLPSIQSTANDSRSTSLGPKRKRSVTPPPLDAQSNDTLTVVKGMSTSPCKGTPTPSKDKHVDGGDTAGGGVPVNN